MSSKFLPQPIRPLRPSIDRWIKAIPKRLFGLVYVFQPLISYEPEPRKPDKELPEEAGDITDEQFELCQAIFDTSEARSTRIEQKAQWTFTAIAFLVPVLASVFGFLLRSPALRVGSDFLSLGLLLGSVCLLILSFISALRGMAIRPRQALYIHSIIDERNGTFLEYKKEFHAQGLLYCATMNAATDDHVAQFVRGAHYLLLYAVIFFALGVIVAGCRMTTRVVPPINAAVPGTIPPSPNVLSELHRDIREVTVANRAAIASTENQIKLLSDRVVALETEVSALRNQVPRASDTSLPP